MNDAAGSQWNSYPGAEKGASHAAGGSRRLIVRICRHILESGAFCQAPAAGKSAYCRAHRQLRVRLARMAQARRQAEVLKLPPPIDLQAVQTSLARVQVALASDRIDPGKARLLRWAMRLASGNLRFIERQKELARPDVLQTVRRYGGTGTGTAAKPRPKALNPRS